MTYTRRTFLAAGGMAAAALFEPRFSLRAVTRYPEDLIDMLQRKVPESMERNGCPGLSLALVEEGALRWAQGFGVTSTVTNEPVDDETVFEAASLGKPVFAAIVLKLAQAGTLDLDMPLGEFFRFPDLRDDPQVDLITPRIVLSHGTGLQNWRPRREPLKIRFKPGGGFSYSGEAYVRLQRAVEKTTGKTLDQLADIHVFQPLQLQHSSYLWKSEYERLAAEGHDPDGKVVRTRLWKYSPDAPAAKRNPPGVDIPLFAVPNAAASLYSTPTEYAAFMVALSKPERAAALELSESSLKLMFSPANTVNDDIRWGLGWGLSSVDGAQHFWHWGNNNVYQSFATASPQRGIVVMTNSEKGLRVCRDVVSTALGVEHPAFAWSMVLR